MASPQKPLPKTPASKIPPASRKKTGLKPVAGKPTRPVRPAAVRSRAQPPHLKQVKSLPQDYRFAAGSPPPADNSDKRSATNSNDNDSIDQMVEEEEVMRGSNNLNLDAREEDAVASVSDNKLVNGDSPYSYDKSNGSIQVETMPEPELATSSRLLEDFQSRGDSRWSDTNSYASKKVTLFLYTPMLSSM